MPATASMPDASAQPAGAMSGPILIDIDETTWKEHVDRAERWLGHVAMVQAEFRTLAEDTAARFDEPHLREQLTKIAEAARAHEARIAELESALESARWKLRETEREACRWRDTAKLATRFADESRLR